MFVGREIGHKIFIGDALKNTPLTNPVRRSYELHRERYNLGHWNHHTADPCSVLYAVRGPQDYWEEVTGGYIDIQDDCSFEWKLDSRKKMGRLIQKMDRLQLGAIMEEILIRYPQAECEP